MAPGTRSSKRSKGDETPEKEVVAEASESHGRVRKKRRESRPSGYPYTEQEVEWKYERYNLLRLTPKAVPGGYENLAGCVNKIMRTLNNRLANKVRDSAVGQYTRLDDLTTRSGNMLHYVVCHQVTPEPNFDPTALFFKIGRKVLRFSRVEYALVSGLKFGPANFKPYVKHELPPDSIFSRLFGANLNTNLCDVRKAYVEKTFEVNGEEVRATPEDYVKLSKFLLCLGYVLGFETIKKKIPLWLWVLLEMEDEWEAFPWGSISYQILLETIKGIPKASKAKNSVNYQFKGNTIAFSAWIFEAIPAFGTAVGLGMPEMQIPRFMRYSYIKERGYPEEAKISEKLVRQLSPTDEELEEVYVKSLEDDKAPNPFAFTYDPTECMKRKNRDEEGGEGENEGEGSALTAQNVSVVEVAKAAVQAGMDALKEFLREYHQTLVTDVANKVTSILLEKAPHETDHYYRERGYEDLHVHRLGDEGDDTACGQPKTLAVPTASDNEDPSVFSLGINNETIVQGNVVEARAKMPPPPPIVIPQIQMDAPTAMRSPPVEASHGKPTAPPATVDTPFSSEKPQV